MPDEARVLLKIAELTIRTQQAVIAELRHYAQHRMTEHSGRFGEDCECGLRAAVEHADALLTSRRYRPSPGTSEKGTDSE